MADLNNIGEQADLFKLFVGQIPKDMDEMALRPYFDEFGPIVEISVIRDNMTMMSKGCAFVTYSYEQSAQMAVDKLHDKVQLPNSINPLQVRFAETQVDRDNKLFIGMLPKTMVEQDLHEMFSIFGDLREVHVIRGPEGGAKGCAFVKFIDREAALAAIENLNDTIPQGGTRPLVVKFADGKKSSKEDPWHQMPMYRHGGGPMGGGMQLSQQRMMYPYGQAPVGLQHGLQGAPSYGQQAGAVGGMSRYGGYPSGIDGVDGKRQQMGDGEFGGAGRTEAYGSGLDVSPPSPLQQHHHGGPQYPMDSESSHVRPPEGPSGANLFIYHLPRDLTDADLATLFAPFGNVISAKVFVDKKTSDSKGFGFVSYDTLENANSAIESMNGFQIGSKRLKVQHKRVLGGPHTTGMSAHPSYGGGGGMMMHQLGLPASMHMEHRGPSSYAPMTQPQQSPYYRSSVASVGSAQGMMMAPQMMQQQPQPYGGGQSLGMMQSGMGQGAYSQPMQMRHSLPSPQQAPQGQNRMPQAQLPAGRGYAYPSYTSAPSAYPSMGQAPQQQQRANLVQPARGPDGGYGSPLQAGAYSPAEQQQQLSPQSMGGMTMPYMDQVGGGGGNKPMSAPPGGSGSAGYYGQY